MNRTIPSKVFLYGITLVSLSGCVGLRAPSSNECSLLSGCAYSADRSVDGRLHHYLGEGSFVDKRSTTVVSKITWVDVETGARVETVVPCADTTSARDCAGSSHLSEHVDQLPGIKETIFGKISL
jgi:hypothetical protein